MGIDRRLPHRKPSHLWIQVRLVGTKVSARLGITLYPSCTGPHSGGHWRRVESLARVLVNYLAFFSI